VPENKNTEIEIKFRGQTYRGLKDSKGLFIGLIGATRPRGPKGEWLEAIKAAGADLPKPPPKRTERVAPERAPSD
jgi:hypothetical protein